MLVGNVSAEPETISQIERVTSGNYQVIATKVGTSCSSAPVQNTITVHETPEPSITNIPACGSATLEASIVSPVDASIAYDYAWTIQGASAPEAINAPQITNTTNTTYSLVVTNRNTSCPSDTVNMDLEIWDIPEVKLVDQGPCAGATHNMSTTITAGSGTIDVYNWVDTDAVFDPATINGASPVVVSAVVGKHAVSFQVEDDHGCISNLAQANVTIGDYLSIQIADQPFCEGSSAMVQNAWKSDASTISSQVWTGDVAILNNATVGNMEPSVITSYSIHYTKLYE